MATVIARIIGMLRRYPSWLTTRQIADRLGADRKYVHEKLVDLENVGDVERRIVGTEAEWRACS